MWTCRTFRATLTATRPMVGRPVRAVYAYEVASSTEVPFSIPVRCFSQMYLRHHGHLRDEIRAMQLYESEVRPFRIHVSSEHSATLAGGWGCVPGVGRRPEALSWCARFD